MVLEYKTRFADVGNSRYILIPSIIWTDSAFQATFAKEIKEMDSGDINLALELDTDNKTITIKPIKKRD